VIKAFLGATTVLLVGAGPAAGPAVSARSVDLRGSGSAHLRTSASATDSTPGALALPQLGSVSFRCGADWSVQPVFDLRGAVATEEVTIRAGEVVRRNFTRRVVGRVHGRPLVEEQFSRGLALAVPPGHYRTVRFAVRQATEARVIEAAVRTDFVAGTFAVRGVSGRLGACYVRRWSVRIDVRPY